jgi:hypothetical protein
VRRARACARTARAPPDRSQARQGPPLRRRRALALFLLTRAAMRSPAASNRRFFRPAPLTLVCVSAAFVSCGGEPESDGVSTDPGAEPIELAQSALLNTSNEFLQYRARSNWSGGAFSGFFSTHIADVTGDGKADAIAVSSGGVTVRRSTGSSFGANETWTTTQFVGGVKTFFTDVTADGRADAIALNANSITVRRSNGSSFNAVETWSSNQFLGSVGTFFADVTGDGRADAIIVNNPGVIVRRSNGTEFNFTTETWLTAQGFGQRATFFADVDGDRKADLVLVNNNGIQVRKSNGSGFGVLETWTTDAFYGGVATFVADATADGAADVIAVNSDGVWMRRSNGFNFGSNELLADQTSAGTPLVADLSADKRADIAEVTSNGILVARSRERIINLRFIQISTTTTPVITEAGIDSVLAVANNVYRPLGVSFRKVGSHLVTSPELGELMASDCSPIAGCGAPTSEVAKLTASFNPSCDIGNVSNMKELDQLLLASTRCTYRGEIPIWITRTMQVDPNDHVTIRDWGSFGAFPKNAVVMHYGDMSPTSWLMAHEIGHYLGLPHVWEGGGFNTQTQSWEGLSMFWDLVYRTSGTSIFPFASKAEAAAFEAQLRIIQTVDPVNGWFCPSGDPNKPCPQNAIAGILGFRVPDATGATQVFHTGSNLIKGLGLRLPNDEPTMNVMSYNYSPNPSNVQQRSASLSLSQVEQIRRVFTFPTSSGVENTNGIVVGAGRTELGRLYYDYVVRSFDAADSRGYTGDGDWAPNEFKGECAPNEWSVGASASADGLDRAHSLLCSSTDSVANFTGVQRTLDITTTNFGFGTHGATDWDFGYLKGECGINEVVTGLAQNFQNGALNHVRCSAVGANATACRPRVFATSNSQESPGAPTDWAFGYYKGECGQGSAIAGVSRAVGTGAVHAILCCDFASL